MLQVYNTCCKNCLLSKDRIVSPQRAKEIIKKCTAEQTYFVCHKASIEEKEVVCKTFFDKLGHVSQMIRIAGRLNAIQFIDQPEGEKLPTFNKQ